MKLKERILEKWNSEYRGNSDIFNEITDIAISETLAEVETIPNKECPDCHHAMGDHAWNSRIVGCQKVENKTICGCRRTINDEIKALKGGAGG